MGRSHPGGCYMSRMPRTTSRIYPPERTMYGLLGMRTTLDESHRTRRMASASRELKKLDVPQDAEQPEGSGTAPTRDLLFRKIQKDNCLETKVRCFQHNTTALLDNGAENNYVTKNYIHKHKIRTIKLVEPFRLVSADANTLLEKDRGAITKITYLELTIQDH